MHTEILFRLEGEVLSLSCVENDRKVVARSVGFEVDEDALRIVVESSICVVLEFRGDVDRVSSEIEVPFIERVDIRLDPLALLPTLIVEGRWNRFRNVGRSIPPLETFKL